MTTPNGQRPIRVGFLGFGVVGTGAYQLLETHRTEIERKLGGPVEVARVAVRDIEKVRVIERSRITLKAEQVVNDPTIDVVLELMGGTDPALKLVTAAIEQGKHVVTANKELMAKHGWSLLKLAFEKGVDLYFEAAVGGGIPLVQPLWHQLAGNRILKICGILNGTTNFVLSRMSDAGLELREAIAEAQKLGYAEADPSADIDGFDAQYKLAILASIAFGREVKPLDIHREGIRSVTKRDIDYARTLGYRIKLLAIAEDRGSGVLARVHPALIPSERSLARVDGVNNAAQIIGDFVGELTFIGPGAGGNATGSAVIGDLMDVCRNIRNGGKGNVIPYERGLKMLGMKDAATPFYLRLRIDDRANALGAIATLVGAQDLSIAAVHRFPIDTALSDLVLILQACPEPELVRVIGLLESLHVVRGVESWLRIEN